MKEFLLKLTYIIVPVFFLVVVTNYSIDPANVFSGKHYVSGIADILAVGHNVDNLSNYDERLLKEQMILRLRKTPDVVVVGASRIMEIGSDFFPNELVLNCGVPHGNIHDVIAVTGLLDSFGRIPPRMVINLDPELVGKGGSSEWQSLSVYHNALLDKQTLENKLDDRISESNAWNKIYSLISFDYFRQSILFVMGGGNKRYYDVRRSRPMSGGRYVDGSVCYSFKYTNPDTAQVAMNARVTGGKTGIPYPDPDKIRLLNFLLDQLQKKHVRVEFVMLPFHPEYYAAVNLNQKNLFCTYDSLFRAVAKQRQIKVYGGFDATVYGVGESEFYDMYHCSKEAIKKVFVDK